MSKNLHPVMAAALAPFSPPDSIVRTIAEEAAAIRVDLAINDMKNSGELRRRETDRAHWLEIQHGDHS